MAEINSSAELEALRVAIRSLDRLPGADARSLGALEIYLQDRLGAAVTVSNPRGGGCFIRVQDSDGIRRYTWCDDAIEACSGLPMEVEPTPTLLEQPSKPRWLRIARDNWWILLLLLIALSGFVGIGLGSRKIEAARVRCEADGQHVQVRTYEGMACIEGRRATR